MKHEVKVNIERAIANGVPIHDIREHLDWLENVVPAKKVYTTGEVAKICQVAPRTATKWFDAGLLKGYLVPGSRDRRVPRDVLVQFMISHGMNHGPKKKTPSQTARENGAKGNPGYAKPELANPGNVIKCNVGKGHMGSDIAHENEAPFPERLAEFFVRSFCPPGGVVYDPFCGSGTTLAVAEKWGRKWIGTDIRESQIELSRRRVAEVSTPLFKQDEA